MNIHPGKLYSSIHPSSTAFHHCLSTTAAQSSGKREGILSKDLHNFMTCISVLIFIKMTSAFEPLLSYFPTGELYKLQHFIPNISKMNAFSRASSTWLAFLRSRLSQFGDNVMSGVLFPVKVQLNLAAASYPVMWMISIFFCQRKTCHNK